MADLIPIQLDAGVSADFTLAEGAERTLSLTTTNSATGFGMFANAEVQKKDGTQYFTCGSLTTTEPVRVLAAAGTFRISKNNSGVPYGVDGE